MHPPLCGRADRRASCCINECKTDKRKCCERRAFAAFLIYRIGDAAKPRIRTRGFSLRSCIPISRLFFLETPESSCFSAFCKSVHRCYSPLKGHLVYRNVCQAFFESHVQDRTRIYPILVVGNAFYAAIIKDSIKKRCVHSANRFAFGSLFNEYVLMLLFGVDRR